MAPTAAPVQHTEGLLLVFFLTFLKSSHDFKVFKHNDGSFCLNQKVTLKLVVLPLRSLSLTSERTNGI